MEELLRTIERIRERIQTYQNQLSKNEALTRYALIDPILRALGWDTEDPDQVVPEFSVPQGVSDYALLHEGKPLLMLEAKSLGTPLSRASTAGVKYAMDVGASYFVLSDGNVWQFYEIKPKPLLFEVCLTEMSPGEAARQLLALWRPAMPTVRPAPASVVERPSEAVPTAASEPEETPSRSLADLANTVQPGQDPPRRLRFPDDSMKDLNYWKDILVEAARYALPELQGRGRLPVQKKSGKVLVGLSEGMKSPRLLEGDVFVDVWSRAKNCVRYACRILREAGIDPATVRVID